MANRPPLSAYPPDGFERRLIERFVSLRRKRVLEVGCGDGRLTLQYASSASSVLAFDPDPLSIDEATWQQQARGMASAYLRLRSKLGFTSRATGSRPPGPVMAIPGRQVRCGRILTSIPPGRSRRPARWRAWTMPRSAIHQSDQLKSATSKDSPLSANPSIEPTRKSMLCIPLACCCQVASSMLRGSGSKARTDEAEAAYCSVRRPSPQPTSRTRLRRRLTNHSI